MNNLKSLQENERYLKRILKRKVSVTESTIVAFLIAGFFGISGISQAAYVVDGNTNSNASWGIGTTSGRGASQPNLGNWNGSVLLSNQRGADNYGGLPNNDDGPKVVLVGYGASAMGHQATALGSNTTAGAQSTAVGSDVFAIGDSSIAIGNDDIATVYVDELPEGTITKIYLDGSRSDRALSNALSRTGFNSRYNQGDNKKYSPTFARGKGSIAIGSRTVAYADGTTALGTLSFALGNRSTAVGLRAFTDFGAHGSTAIGEEARTFAENTISIGNRTEATSIGSLAFGNLSRAVGRGSIAIGESVASNALLDDNNLNLLKDKIDHYSGFSNYKSGDANKLVEAGFASKQSQNIVTNAINSLITDVNKFKYQNDGKIVIKTTENIYKTQKKGDHAISLGYYLVNTGNNTVGIGTASRIHGANSVAIGALNVIDENAANSIAIGVGTRVEKENTLAFGTGALGLGAGSIVLGPGAYATKDNTIALGYGAEVKSLAALGIGSSTKISETSDSSIAIGNKSFIGENSKNSTAIGVEAKVAKDTQQGMAIGNKAEANLVNSTALGFESRTDYSLTDLSEPGYTPRGSYTIPTSARTGIISVGRIGEERRITNLASGFRDTDAVNVAQLRALEDRFEFSVSGFDDKAINYVSINSDGGDAGRVKEIALREVQYKEYVKLKKLEATLEVRKQSGDNLDPAKVKELYDRIRELEAGTNGQRFKNAAIDLIDTIGKIKRTTNNPYFTNGQSGANFKRDDAYAHIDRDEATANNNISSIVSDDERNITKDTNFDNKGAKSADALSIGYKAFVEEGSENSIAIGKESKINKNTTNSVAIGYKASAGVSNNNPVTDAIAIGQQTKAQGNYSVVLGYKSQVDNSGGIAIGKEAKTHNSSASAIAIGDGAQVSNAEKAIAIGNGASVSATSGNSNFSIAIGDGSQVTSGYSVAVGKSSKATDTGTSAFGENSKATAERATAIGNNSNASGKNAVALAFQASASGENSTALGHRANTSGTNSTALGANSSANIEGGVAIGSHSATTVDKHINGYDPETNATSTNNNATWKSTNAAVSVGHRRNNNEITRQITNVAAGTHDTDAVNVAQLKKLRDAAVVKYFSVNSSKNGNKNNDGAINNDTVAIGPNAKAEGHNSIAIGHNATTANGASFAFGYDVTVKGDNSIGIGKGITFAEQNGAKGDYTVAIGSNITVAKDATHSVAIGRDASVTQVGATAIGESSKAQNQRATAIGNNSTVTAIGGVALGYESVSNRAANDNATTGYDILVDGGKSNPDSIWKATTGAVSVGDTGKTRQITNVAAGRTDTDAVNVAQLKQVKLQYRSQNSTGNASSTQSATIAQGLLFKSGSNELKINAKANGEVEFKVELPTSPDNKLTFKAENSTEFERKNSQDKKVEIVSGDFAKSTGTGAATNYKAKNLATELTASGNTATIKVGLKDEVEFTKVSINSGTAQGPTLSTSGIDMGNKNISNLSKGTANDHAVRFDQLKDLDGVQGSKIKDKIEKGDLKASNGLTLAGTGTGRLVGAGDLTVKLDDATKAKIDALPDDIPGNIADATKWLKVKASNDQTEFVRTNNDNKTLTVTEGNIGADYVGNNLKTSIDANGNLKIGFKKAATFDSVAITNGPTLSSTGIAMNNKPITGVADIPAASIGNGNQPGDGQSDTNAVNFKTLKNLLGVHDQTVTSKVQKGNLVVEDGIEIKDNGSGANRLIGTGDLKIGLTDATKATLAKVGTGVISTTDPNKANTVTGEAVQNALNNLTIKYNDGKQGSVAKASKLSDGLKFVSKSDNLTIEAKDGGSIEFTITDELDKDLTDLTDDGKNVIKNQAIQAVKVVKDTTNTGNPITVTEDDTVANTKTYKIGIDNDKLKAAVGLPTGTVTKDSGDAVTGGKIFDAIKTAKTLVDKKDGETFITVEKTESADDITANSYKIGLNITPLSAELAKTFAKQDASNITSDAHKTAWRNALNVYDKPEVDTKVKAATEKVENAANSILTVSDEAGVDGLGKTYKVGLTADKVKEVAGTDTLGNLGVDGNDLTITGTGTNRLLGAGNVSISLSNAVKETLGKVGTGVISGTDANKDKTVTGKAVYDYVKANVGDKSITFSADNDDATYTRANSETGAVSIKSGAVDTDFVGENLKTKIDTNGNILVGFRKAPKFESIVVGTNANNAQNISINNNGIDLKERGITGLVKGKADNEAVNVSQLRPFATALGGSSKIDDNGDLTQPTYALKGGEENPTNYNNVGAGLAALDDAISKIKNAEFSEKGKEDVRDLAREAVKVKADDQVKNNPIKVRADKTQTENTTYNISIDIDKLKQEAGLSSGEVADGDNDTVTGDKVYDAIKNAKTTVDKKDGEQYISVDKTEPNDITANSYKIGLNLNPLTTKLGETFVKLDGTNLDTNDKKATFRNAINVYDKTHVDNLTVKYTDGGAQSTPKTTKLTDGFKFASTNEKLTVTAKDNGEISFGLNLPDDIPTEVADGTKTFTVKASVLEGNTNPAGYVKTNNDDRALTFIEGDITDNSINYKGTNLKTSLSADGTIKIGFKEMPTFKGTIFDPVGDGSKTITMTPTADGSGIKFEKSPEDPKGDKRVTIEGVKDGTSPDSVVTKGTFDQIVGRDGKDGKDGRNGTNGFDGNEITQPESLVGPAGKDGLNGTSVNEKANALRRGEAGPVVFTTEDGTRIAKARDGKLFKKENVTPNGDLTDGTYVKVGEDYYKKSQLDENGLVREGEEKITDQDELAAATAAIEAIANAPISPENVRHSLVNIDGSTQENPSVLSNIASGINPEEIGKNAGAITEEKASNNVKTLLGLADKAKLNTAATVGDLQAVAKAGLNFKGNVATGNNEATTHRALTETLEIVGKDGVSDFADYTTDNVATKVSEGKIEIGFKKAPKFDSLIIGTNADNSKNVNISDTGIAMGDKKITGLAKGTENTDAVTKEQLQDVLSKLGGGTGTTAPTIDGNGAVTGPVYKLMAGQKQPTKEEADNGAQPVTTDFVNVGTALKALDQAIENVKNAEFTEKGAEDVRNLAREAVKVKAKEDANNAITVNPIKTTEENTTYELFVEKTDSIAANAGTDITPAPADQDAPTKHPNRLVTEKAVVDYVATKVTPVANNTLTFGADNADTFERKNSEDKTVSIKATTNAITVGTSADKYLGNNLTTKLVAAQDGKSAEILIGLKESPQFKDVFASDRIAIGTPTQSGPALTKDGIDGGNKPVFNVAKGVNNDDVITVSQLKPLLDRLGATLKTDGTDDNGQKDKNGTVTAPTFDLKTGAQAPDTTKAYDTVGDALKALDEKLSKTATGTSSLTFSDGNAANNFVRENNENKTVTITNADNEKNVSVALSKNQDGTVGTFKVALANDLKEITSITNGDGTNPDTKSKIALADDSVKVSVQGKDLTITKVGEQGKEGISITGLEERDIDSDNYGIDNSDNNGVNNKTRAATEGAVKHLSDVLGANITIVNKIGPAGKDGLDGKSIVEKVEGLRDGQSGPIVYTDENGKRLIKDPKDGKYYVMKKDGTKDENQEVDQENVRLSMVDPAGETTEPITIGNLASALGLDKVKADGSGNYTKPISNADAKDVIGGLLTKADDLNRAVTLADLQALAVAGLDFTGNTTLDGAQNVTNNTTRRKLSEKLTIIGKEQVASFDEYSTDNLATRVSEGKIEIGMLKTPRFDALELGAKGTNPDKKITLTPDTENGKLTLGKVTTPEDPKVTNPEKVVLDGLRAGDTPDSAVTKAQLDALAKKVGGTEEDVTDGRNGTNGLDGEKVQAGNAGAAGKDGLNGKDLNEKVNALRRGEAGPVVYTTENGERLVKGLDGKLYKPEEIKDKVFVEGTGYVNKADASDDDGDGVYTLTNQNATPVEAYALSANKDKVRHSLVNIDGSTTEPSVLANVASGIGAVVTSEEGVAPEVKFTTGSEDAAITPDKATKVTEALLGIDKKAKLNTAATVGDLQAVAQAGLDFKGNVGGNNDDKTTHRTLASTLEIVGTSEAVADFNDTHSTINVATKVSDGKIEIGFRKTPEFEALKLKTLAAGNADDKTVTLTPSDDGNKLTISGPKGPVELDGIAPGTSPNSAINKAQFDELAKKAGDSSKDGEDGRNGAKGLDGQDAPRGDAGPAGKDGLNGTSVNEKTNALRRGEAGPVVYTKDDGTRLRKANDGKLYDHESVTAAGDLKTDEYVKVLQPDGTYKYYAKNQVDANGELVKGAQELDEDTKALAEAEFAKLETVEPETVKHSLVNIDGDTTKPSKLSNLAEGEISATSKDAINGSQLFSLKETLGLADDKGSKDGTHGPAGKDGLNGTSILDKVQGLRDGSAGNTVYTLPNGDRVVRGEDGKLYRPDDIKDKVYVDGKGYVDPADVDEPNPTVATSLTPEEEEKVVISAVNPDGTTTKPTGIANVASGLGLNGKNAADQDYNKPITAAEAKNVVAGADGQGGLLAQNSDQELNKVATVRDLQALAQAGLDFKGNVGENDATTHRTLASTLQIVGTDTKIDDFDKSHSTINVATRVTEGKIEVGFRKAPEFEELKLKSLKAGDENKAVTLTPSENGDKLTISGPNKEPVELDGIAPGTSPNSAVNKAQLDELADKLGDVAKDGEDGRNGAKGLDGQDADKGDVGPAGKDGLNGKDLNEKVNALRRGEAGPIVYTDLEGNRLVKGLDGKLYKADELENKVFVDGTGYVDKDKTDEQEDGTYTLKQGEQADPVAEFERGENNENVRLSGVNIDGSTDKPTELANIASGLGLNGKKPKTDPAAAAEDYAKPITIEEAQGVVAGNNDNPGGLVGLVDDAKLNKVATVRDLQALAIAGMEFGANGNEKIHRTLGTKIDITGKKENTFSEEKFSFDNVVTKVDTTGAENAIRIGFAKKPVFEGLELVVPKKPDAPEDQEPTKITFTPTENGGINLGKTPATPKDPADPNDPEGNKVVISGVKDGDTPDSVVTKGTVDEIIKEIGGIGRDGKDGKDGRDGSKGLDGETTEKFGPAGKDGLNGTSVNERVNALRRGEAGAIVYTDPDGNRLIKGFDGKLYKQQDLVDKVFIEGLGENGEGAFVHKDQAEQKEDGTWKVKDDVENPEITQPFALNEQAEKVKHSLVNIDGTTTKPSVLANVASGIDPKAIGTEDKAIEPEAAKTATKALLAKNKASELNTAATIGDLQAVAQTGLTLAGNVGTGETDELRAKNESHRPLGSKISVIGKSGVNKFDDYSTDNVATRIDTTNGTIEIGLLKTPRFDALELGAKPEAGQPDKKITLTPDAEKGRLTLGKVTTPEQPNATPEDNKVVLDGLAAGDTPDSAVTKQQLDDLAKKVGGTEKDTEDGRNGGKDLDGNPVQDGNAGAAGKDGLNGKDLNEKVNALRRGEAGPVVYTTENGERLVKGLDGKLYKAEEIKDKVYVEGKGYVAEAEKDNDDAQAAEAYALTSNKDKVRHSLVNIDGTTNTPSVLSNVADGEISATSTDAINGSQLFKLVGDASKDGQDGRNGENGLDGTSAPEKDAGLAGKDGLNGKDLNEKVNSLRRGESGAVVFTKEDGTRLAKANDGKLYDKDNVTASGDLTDGTYVKVGDSYYKAEQLDENGKVKDGEAALTEAEEIAKATAAIDALKSTKPEDVVHSLVNIDGTTTKPSSLKNIASGLDPEKIGKEAKAIEADDAKKLVAGDPANANDKGLLGITDKAKLNTAATVGDLQALAQAGIDFGANTGADIHRTLGSKLSIVGNKAEFERINDLAEDKKAEELRNYLAKFNDKNIITTTNADEISIKFAERPEFKGIDVADPEKAGKQIQVEADGINAVDQTGDTLKVSTTNADGLSAAIVKKDPTTGLAALNGDDPIVEKVANYDATGATIVDLTDNGKVTEIKPNEITLGDKDGTSLTIKGKDGDKGAAITGLGDLDENSDGSSAANKNYVDKLAKAATTEVESTDGSINLMPTIDAVNKNTTYNLSVNKGTLSVSPEGEVSADKTGNAFVTAENAADAINKAAKAAKTEITTTDKSVLIDETTGINGNTIYDISIKKDGKVEKGNDDLVTGDTVAKAVEKAAAAAKTEVEAGKNVVVKESQGDNGQTIYEVSTVDRPEFKGIDIADPAKAGKQIQVEADGINAVDQTGEKLKVSTTNADGLSAAIIEKDPVTGSPVIENGKPKVEKAASYDAEGAKIVDLKDNGKFTDIKPNVITLGDDEGTSITIDGNSKTITGLASGLGKDTSTTDKAKEVVAELAKDLTVDKPVYDISKIATVGDLRTLATAGLTFAGNKGAGEVHRTLGNSLTIKGEGTDVADKANFTSAAGNIKVEAKDNTLEVKLSDKLVNMTSFETKEVDGKKVTITNNGLTAVEKVGDNTITNVVNAKGSTITEVDKAGKELGKAEYTIAGNTYTDAAGNTTSVGKDGLSVTNKEDGSKVAITKDGIDAGGKAITNVGEGKVEAGSTDAVTGGQVHNIVNGMNERIQSNTHRIDKIEKTVGQGLANSAAMSTIEFMDIGINQYTVGAAVGTYKGTQAVAVGVQAAPTESMRVHAKMAVTPGAQNNVMAGVGASWRFNFK